MKTALVHEWIVNFTGSERVLKEFTKLYPKAPIYTTVYDQEKAPQFGNQVINTSFIQKFPGGKKFYRYFFPFMPYVFESFDLDQFDLVLSDSSSCAKGVLTNPDTCHICYCHTPTRYLWEPWLDDRAKGGLIRESILTYMRVWDRQAAARPDYFIANSRYVAKKIKKYYNRHAEVVYPPVDTSTFEPTDNPQKGYYLVVSRLVGQKKTELAVRAFVKMNKPLKVVGDGPEKKKLEKIADGSKVEILGFKDDNILRNLYQNCIALIFPQEEDFGITPLEAMASGRPVIAYGKGGALETVIKGKTGTFFNHQTVDSLVKVVEKFDESEYMINDLTSRAEEFNQEVFKKRIKQVVSKYYSDWQS
jgi:glycosyltransferase involved in cell wall biosynthesis